MNNCILYKEKTSTKDKFPRQVWTGNSIEFLEFAIKAVIYKLPCIYKNN